MSPAIIHYRNNLYGGGFDENGVPLDKGLDGKVYYFPINIAQYGFILHARWLRNKKKEDLINLKNCIDKLDEIKTEKDNYCVWLHKHKNIKYNIPPPWASSMAQGELISLYLRAYQLFNNKKYLNTAIKAYNFLEIELKDGGVKLIDHDETYIRRYPQIHHHLF